MIEVTKHKVSFKLTCNISEIIKVVKENTKNRDYNLIK